MLALSHVILHVGFCGAIARTPAGTSVALRVHLADRAGRTQVDRVYRFERGDEAEAIVEFDSAFGSYRIDLAHRNIAARRPIICSLSPATTAASPKSSPMRRRRCSRHPSCSPARRRSRFSTCSRRSCSSIRARRRATSRCRSRCRATSPSRTTKTPITSGSTPIRRPHRRSQQLALRLRTPTHQYHYVRVPIPFPVPRTGWPSSVHPQRDRGHGRRTRRRADQHAALSEVVAHLGGITQ